MFGGFRITVVEEINYIARGKLYGVGRGRKGRDRTRRRKFFCFWIRTSFNVFALVWYHLFGSVETAVWSPVASDGGVVNLEASTVVGPGFESRPEGEVFLGTGRAS